jgi:carboxypeptidase PM20D1
MRRILLVLVTIVVVLATVLVLRTVGGPGAEKPAAPIAVRPVDASRLAEILAGAIRIPTVSYDASGPAAEQLAALRAHLRASFPQVFARLELEEFPDGAFMLTWRGHDAQLAPIVLMAHQDVVPVPDDALASWTHAPFSGEVAGGFVWGRGALDDKASLVTILAAVESLLEEGFAPARTVVLASGHDEEVGGRGARAIAAAFAARGLRPGLVLDEGLVVTRGIVPGLSRPVALLGSAEKGYASFELSVEAEGGHSSMPRRETAISILVAALARVTREPLPARADAPVWRMLDALLPDLPFGQRVALSNRWLFGRLVAHQLGAVPSTDAMLRTTLAPTLLQAGVKENVLPSKARAVLNLRLIPGDTVTAIESELRHRIADDRVKLALASDGIASEASSVSPTTGWGYALLRRSVREVLPEAIVAPGLMVGATDARHFGALSDQVFRFQPVVLGPDDLPRFHGIDERISIENLALAMRLYARLIENGGG